MQAWVDEVVARHGRIDVLVNNAGITRDAQLVKVKDGELVGQLPEEDFDRVIAINLKGVFTCTQAVVPVMIRQGAGAIVSASSGGRVRRQLRPDELRRDEGRCHRDDEGLGA